MYLYFYTPITILVVATEKNWEPYYYTWGDRYVGYWSNNLRSDQGTMYFANGQHYEGEWRNDNQTNGKLYFPTAEVCITENGKLHPPCNPDFILQ